MIDESGGVSHESGIDCSLGRAKVIKTIIDAETFPEDIDAVIDQLSTVYHQKFILSHNFSSKKAQACLTDGRPSHPHSLELSAEDGMVSACFFHIFSEAAGTDEGIAFCTTAETGTFISSAVYFFTAASSFTDGAVVTAHALR